MMIYLSPKGIQVLEDAGITNCGFMSEDEFCKPMESDRTAKELSKGAKLAALQTAGLRVEIHDTNQWRVIEGAGFKLVVHPNKKQSRILLFPDETIEDVTGIPSQETVEDRLNAKNLQLEIDRLKRKLEVANANDDKPEVKTGKRDKGGAK
jgi:hypothetical protein